MAKNCITFSFLKFAHMWPFHITKSNRHSDEGKVNFTNLDYVGLIENSVHLLLSENIIANSTKLFYGKYGQNISVLIVFLLCLVETPALW